MGRVKPETSKHYKVTVGFIDDSYWDDGNRSTSQTFSFKSYAEMTRFRDKVFVDKQLELQGQDAKKVFSINWLRTVIIEETSKIYDI